MFKQYTYMNDIRVYSIRTYEKQIYHDYYCQIVAHEVCDLKLCIIMLALLHEVKNPCGKQHAIIHAFGYIVIVHPFSQCSM